MARASKAGSKGNVAGTPQEPAVVAGEHVSRRAAFDSGELVADASRLHAEYAAGALLACEAMTYRHAHRLAFARETQLAAAAGSGTLRHRLKSELRSWFRDFA